MAKYLILNLFVLVAAYMVLRPRVNLTKPHAIALGVLLLLTAVFDSLLVITHVIDYNPAYILGIRIGAAPLEDFAYPILAFFATPVLWRYFGGKHGK